MYWFFFVEGAIAPASPLYPISSLCGPAQKKIKPAASQIPRSKRISRGHLVGRRPARAWPPLCLAICNDRGSVPPIFCSVCLCYGGGIQRIALNVQAGGQHYFIRLDQTHLG